MARILGKIFKLVSSRFQLSHCLVFRKCRGASHLRRPSWTKCIILWIPTRISIRRESWPLRNPTAATFKGIQFTTRLGIIKSSKIWRSSSRLSTLPCFRPKICSSTTSRSLSRGKTRHSSRYKVSKGGAPLWERELTESRKSRREAEAGAHVATTKSRVPTRSRPRQNEDTITPSSKIWMSAENHYNANTAAPHRTWWFRALSHSKGAKATQIQRWKSTGRIS